LNLEPILSKIIFHPQDAGQYMASNTQVLKGHIL